MVALRSLRGQADQHASRLAYRVETHGERAEGDVTGGPFDPGPFLGTLLPDKQLSDRCQV